MEQFAYKYKKKQLNHYSYLNKNLKLIHYTVILFGKTGVIAPTFWFLFVIRNLHFVYVYVHMKVYACIPCIKIAQA